MAQAQLRATQEARSRIVDLAVAWLRLAEWVEQKQQPQVQQQQQIQPENADCSEHFFSRRV